MRRGRRRRHSRRFGDRRRPATTKSPSRHEAPDEPAPDDTTSEDDDDDSGPVVVTIAPEENSDPVVGGTLRYGLEADSQRPQPGRLEPRRVRTDDGQRRVRHAVGARRPMANGCPYLAESFTPSDDFTLLDGQAARGHHVPRRHAAQRRGRWSPTSSPSVHTRWSASPSSRSTPRRGRPRSSTTSPCTYNLLDPDAKWPTAVIDPARHGRLADLARSSGRRRLAQPGTGRHRSVRVRQPQRGLGDPVRPQRQLVERRGLPRRRRVLPGSRPRRLATTCCSAARLNALHTTNQASTLDLRDDGAIQARRERRRRGVVRDDQLDACHRSTTSGPARRSPWRPPSTSTTT